jgi:tetratricopeptide (TPR) repeat protein
MLRTTSGRSRQRPLTAVAAAILCLAAAAGATPSTEPAAEDLRIPHPDLSAMDEVVRHKVEAAQERLATMVEGWRPGEPAVELSDGFGRLGQLFHAFRRLDAAEVCYGNAQRLAPDDYRWPHYLGLVRNAKGALAAAAEDYRRALELKADDLPTQIRLGTVLLELGAPRDAEPLFTRALSRSPEAAAAAHFGLGKVAVADGDHAAAVSHFEQALAAEPGASEIHYPLAQAYRKLGDLEKAREHLGQRGEGEVHFPDPLGSRILRLAQAAAFEIVLSLARDSESVSEEEFLGFALSQFGDVKGTIEELEQGLVLEQYSGTPSDPRHLARIHYVLGGLLVNDGRDADAIDHYRRAIELDPSLVDTRIKLGNALARGERFEDAMAAYGAVLAAHPDNHAALLKQAATLMSLERDAEAQPLLEQLLALEPEHSEAMVRLAAILERRGEIDRAIDLRRRASRLDLRLPEAIQVRYQLAGSLRRRGALEEALAEYRWIVDADRDFIPGLAGLARLLGQLGRFDESAKVHAEWVAKEPKNLEARLGEITALTFAGRHLEVKQRLEAGIAELVDNLALKDVLARHLAACPDHSVRDGARAVELALEVYQKVPSAESIETLAMAYAQAGRFAEAIEWQEHLLTKAEEAGDAATVARIKGNLELYQAGKACCAGEG